MRAGGARGGRRGGQRGDPRGLLLVGRLRRGPAEPGELLRWRPVSGPLRRRRQPPVERSVLTRRIRRHGRGGGRRSGGEHLHGGYTFNGTTLDYGGGPVDREQIYVAKFNSSGVFQWSDSFGSGTDQGNGSRQLNVVVTGIHHHRGRFRGRHHRSRGWQRHLRGPVDRGRSPLPGARGSVTPRTRGAWMWPSTGPATSWWSGRCLAPWISAGASDGQRSRPVRRVVLFGRRSQLELGLRRDFHRRGEASWLRPP